MRWMRGSAIVAACCIGAGSALADAALPRSFVGTWASKRAHCDLDGVYALHQKGWIEGETWTCELTGIARSRGRATLKGTCVSEQTSERAERRLEIRTSGNRLTHIDGLPVLRCG